ncbi:hypothetical protein [Lactococcus lactis]|uniref:Uncharacterized protein n=1 Tax=Lactococcus lactis subsp. lactis TaxID=1360 RepID=A0A0V8E3R3_LACLL|nr:hypothetical protein [Lactococcus lactis]KSU20379.1 hypothetical protein M20_1544 [Lactococcus lactis subsp. lactis]
MKIRYNRKKIFDNNLGVIYVLLLLLMFTIILKGTLAFFCSLFIGFMLFISIILTIIDGRKKEVDSVSKDLPNSYERFVELHIFDKELNRQILILGDERYRYFVIDNFNNYRRMTLV